MDKNNPYGKQTPNCHLHKAKHHLTLMIRYSKLELLHITCIVRKDLTGSKSMLDYTDVNIWSQQ